jgi:transposase
LNQLVDWLAKYSCNEVCMESAGKYWIPVFNVLEKHVFVSLAHPKYTKPQKGNKTDRKDAKWICDLFMCDMIKPSYIPSPDIRQLRDLMRYDTKLTNMITGEKNRAQNCLTVSNLKLDDVFSDVFGKSSRSIIQHILAHPGETFDVAPFVDKRCKHPIEEVEAAVDGAICQEQAVKLRECLAHIDELQAHREQIHREIMNLADKYAYPLELLRTVPGFSANPMTAVAVIAKIGADMFVFPPAKHLALWASYCPRNGQSGGKSKSAHISRVRAYLKPLLVQVANALIKSDKHPEFRNRYRRIKARRGHKKAIIAVCRMILTAVWNVLSKLEPYDPSGFVTPKLLPRSKVLSIDEGLRLLKAQGFVIREISDPVLSG